MFEALVMGCLLMSDGDCVVFSDTRGPYQTKEQCVARAHEMTLITSYGISRYAARIHLQMRK